MSELNIPESWAETSIGSICEKTQQGKPKSTFTYIDINSIDNTEGIVSAPKSLQQKEAPSRARKIVAEGDVIFSTVRPYLRNIAIVPSVQNPIASTGFCVLRTQIYERFLLWNYLRSDFFLKQVEPHQKGASYPAVTDKAVMSLPIPLPPLGEQKRIVAKIESTSEKIKAIESAVTQAESLITKYRESLLAKAFRGELVPQDPNDEPASKLLERIRAERAKAQDGKKKKKDDLPPIKEEEIPFEIPKSWEWVRLGDIADLTGGVTVDSKRTPADPVRIPYLRVANVQRGFLDLREKKEIVVDRMTLNALALCEGDILYTEGGDIDKLGRGWVWENEWDLAIHQNHVFRARIGLDVQLSKFISRYSNSFGKEYFLRAGKKTTNLASINITKLSLLPVPLPPLNVAIKIEKQIRQNWDICDTASQFCKNSEKYLSRLRNTILTSAFSGRLVPQDPTEGTGHELLAKIQSSSNSQEEKKTLPKAKRKKEKQ